MVSPKTVYVVTGSARGLGLAFVQELSARPNSIIFAGVRSIPTPDSPLGQLAARLPEVVFPIMITSGDEKDNAAAAETIKAKVGKVDVLIANAGALFGTINNSFTDVNISDLRANFEINTIGFLVLYKAFNSLLLSSSQPKLIAISSFAGQIAEKKEGIEVGYGASKAALNYIVTKIDQQVPNLIAFAIHPGFVDTPGLADVLRLANVGFTGSEAGAISSEDSAKGVLGVIDVATKESHGGKFWSYTGEQETW